MSAAHLRSVGRPYMNLTALHDSCQTSGQENTVFQTRRSAEDCYIVDELLRTLFHVAGNF